MAVHDEFFEELLKRGPSPGAVFLILTRMKQEGRLNEVVQACIRFLTLYPDDIRLRTLLAESYAEMGFITLSGFEFEKAVSMIDAMIPAYRLLAGIYARQRRHSEAADMLRRYLAHYPDRQEAIELLERMETARIPEKGPSEVESAQEDMPLSEEETAEALVDFATPTIAELYYSQGQIDAAIHTYEKVVTQNPEDHDSLNRLKELKMLTAVRREAPAKGGDTPRIQKERMITILDRWLPRIRGLRHA